MRIVPLSTADLKKFENQRFGSGYRFRGCEKKAVYVAR
jgi:hypothetical protein